VNKNTKKPTKFGQTLLKLRYYSLIIAEGFDAWRITPRLMLMSYAALVLNLYLWYKTIPTYVQEKCDASVLQILIQNKMPVDDAQKISCTVDGVVGGPTPAQTTLVTTIIGLSSLIFGFYANSGRKWENGLPPDANPFQDQPQQPVCDPNAGNIPPIPTLPPMPLPVAPVPTPDPGAASSSSDTKIY
jgi:hypothetical protein